MADVPGRSWVVAAAIACLGVLLSGSSVVGDIHVTADDVSMDVIIRYPRSVQGFQPCDIDGLPSGLSQHPVAPHEPDEVACSVTGTVPLIDEESQYWTSPMLWANGPYLYWMMPAQHFGWWSEDGPRPTATFDVTIHFPGEVLATDGGGEVTGSSVRWNDFASLQRRGMAATVRMRPTWPAWVPPAAVGLALGASGAAAAVWLARRRAGSRERPDAALPAAAAAPAEPAVTPPPPEDPEVWARL